jgi:hypothetical protein
MPYYQVQLVIGAIGNIKMYYGILAPFPFMVGKRYLLLVYVYLPAGAGNNNNYNKK